MDEMSVRNNMVLNTTDEATGSKDANEINWAWEISVMVSLTAKNDSTKLKPLIVFTGEKRIKSPHKQLKVFCC